MVQKCKVGVVDHVMFEATLDWPRAGPVEGEGTGTRFFNRFLFTR